MVAHILGFPRIGRHREMKGAVEAYWDRKIDLAALLETGKAIRQENWQIQLKAGLDFITVGDFSWYDHVLDMAMLLGVIPARFDKITKDPQQQYDTMFRMARGRAPTGNDTTACEMTKWFDTNYHYIVPELSDKQRFTVTNFKLFDEIKEAQALGHPVKPVLIGPLTFLWLSKNQSRTSSRRQLLTPLTEAYEEILVHLKSLNISWVQLDEPILGLDLPEDWQAAFKHCYERLALKDISILLTTYFSPITENSRLACHLPVAGLHIDVTQYSELLTLISKRLSAQSILSAGIINGRNIWRTDLAHAYDQLLKTNVRLQDRLWIGSSCSLLHVPIDLQEEKSLDEEMRSWFAFGVQKIDEIVTLTKALSAQQRPHTTILHTDSSRIHQGHIQERLNQIHPDMFIRNQAYQARVIQQRNALKLPLFPTTSIGSFPQTHEIRQVRRAFKQGDITQEIYEQSIRQQIKQTIIAQEEIGLDVLVHGEAERNDMVEYFAELLQGFTITENGWVQSYGSRCVKPPIIYGDIARNEAMTTRWITYAQSLTQRPVKGMLTGPVTMLCWSFVREDVPHPQVAMQMALALRDEIANLEANGITIIQLDEPAFREGLPLRHKDWPAYLDWAVKAFRLATSGVKPSTQIHSHMCYSEFNDVIQSIADLDADVITLETARSKMELLSAFEHFHYTQGIGPGVYDVHSPRVPTIDEMVELLNKAATVISPQQIWVNPDCGLKTRHWEEVKPALLNMVAAANTMRTQLKVNKS